MAYSTVVLKTSVFWGGELLFSIRSKTSRSLLKVITKKREQEEPGLREVHSQQHGEGR